MTGIGAGAAKQSIRTRGAEGGRGDVSKGDERLHGEQQQRRRQRGRQVPQRPLQRVAAALALVHRHHHPLPLPQLRRPRGHRPATRVLDRSSFSLSHRSQAALNLLLLQAIGASVAWLLELGGCAGPHGCYAASGGANFRRSTTGTRQEMDRPCSQKFFTISVTLNIRTVLNIIKKITNYTI